MKKDPNRLIDSDGEFISEFPGGSDSDGTSIGYLEDLCEWMYYHGTADNQSKLGLVLQLEDIIQEYLNGGFDHKSPMGIKCNYIPTWSKKLMKLMEKNNI
jgi:hypothetical protein